MKLNYTKEYKCIYSELGETEAPMMTFVYPYIDLYNLTFPNRQKILPGSFDISVEGIEVDRFDIVKMIEYLEQCTRVEFNKFYMSNFSTMDRYRLFYAMLIKLSLVPDDKTNNGIIKLLAF